MARIYNSNKSTLDEVRMSAVLACDKLEQCPPTSNAARFHISRSFCQASKLYYSDINNHDALPSHVDSGGYRLNGDVLEPILMTLDPMPSTIEQVISCNCMGKCDTKRCPCKSKQTKCTLLCHKKQKYDHSNCLNWIESYDFIQISSMLQ